MISSFAHSEHSIVAMCYSNVPCDLSVQFLCQHFDGFLSETPFHRHPRNRCNCDSLYMLRELISITSDKFSHCDLQWHELQFIVFGDTKQSRANVFSSFLIQRTTFHLVPTRHRLGREAKFLSPTDYFCLFFNQLDSVGRLTPNTRCTPRILERS